MRGHRHDCARAVRDQYVVSNPNWDWRAVHGVGCKCANEHAGLVFAGGFAFDVCAPRHFRNISVHGGFLRGRGQLGNQRMFRRQHHKCCAPKRVWAGGEHLNRICLCGKKCDLCAGAAADPVCLQRAHALRPVDAFKVQQLVGVLGNAEVPLVQILLDDRRLAALAMPVVAPHLLARQRGVAVWAPVHRRQFFISQPVLEQLRKNPLGPAVVLGVAAHGFAVPVPHGAHGAQLLAHVGDVAVGPLLGMDAALDGGILGGQAKGVEANRVHDVVAAHAQVAGACIGRRHCIPVANVQVAAGVGQHGERVKLGARPVHLCAVEAIALPALLPALLNLFGCVARRVVRHRWFLVLRAGCGSPRCSGRVCSSGLQLLRPIVNCCT